MLGLDVGVLEALGHLLGGLAVRHRFPGLLLAKKFPSFLLTLCVCLDADGRQSYFDVVDVLVVEVLGCCPSDKT